MILNVLGYASAGIFGLGLGLHFGRLLSAIIVNWESTENASKGMIKAAGFLVGGGVGALIFQHFDGLALTYTYLLGLAIALVFAFFRPNLPSGFSRNAIKNVIQLNNSLIERGVTEEDDRITLIQATIEPPKAIQRTESKSQNEIAHQLGKAADALSEDIED